MKRRGFFKTLAGGVAGLFVGSAAKGEKPVIDIAAEKMQSLRENASYSDDSWAYDHIPHYKVYVGPGHTVSSTRLCGVVKRSDSGDAEIDLTVCGGGTLMLDGDADIKIRNLSLDDGAIRGRDAFVVTMADMTDTPKDGRG